jgi:mannose-6-phosphate isomerase-like protein (cupin superfamily)
MEGFVRKAAEGDARWFYGNLFVIKAGGPGTGGRFSLIEATSPPGFEPGMHIHQDEDEAFYVLDGMLHGRCGDAGWTASAGDFVFIPRDTPHNFTVMGQTAARYLLINSPPGFAAEVARAPQAQARTLPPPGA